MTGTSHRGTRGVAARSELFAVEVAGSGRPVAAR
ncbi:hypothetical protein BJY16_004635 [Actinoplanes octamycinicus]|uniref:Uncharacterized protein n=1 Tax=Actinoplanes octamycinicus TaxID=135948 RepID=A0A7W7GZH2_9ACTN|nr:hypothetical protein [Actinoplanes octamycinicus]